LEDTLSDLRREIQEVTSMSWRRAKVLIRTSINNSVTVIHDIRAAKQLLAPQLPRATALRSEYTRAVALWPELFPVEWPLV
jgi:hypothetical protein